MSDATTAIKAMRYQDPKTPVRTPPVRTSPFRALDIKIEDLPEIVQIPRETFLDLCFRSQLLNSLQSSGFEAASPAIVASPATVTSPSTASSPANIASPATVAWTPRAKSKPSFSTPHDKQTPESGQPRLNISHEPPAPCLQPEGNMPPPPDQTLIIGPLPLQLRIRDLVHSLTAPGGLRQIHFSATPDAEFQVAAITFMTTNGAAAYKAYVDENGFFLSMRVREDDHSDAGDLGGETRTGVIQTMPDGRGTKKVFLIKKHMADVVVRYWGKDKYGKKLHSDDQLYLEYEHSLLKWFLLDDTWFCNLPTEVEKGSTRQLKVVGNSEQILEELEHLRFSPYEGVGGGCSLEFVNFNHNNNARVMKDPKKSPGEKALLLRFFSLRESVMAKRYFDVRCGYEGKAFFVRDYADREVGNLRWDTFPKVGESASEKRVKMRVVAGGFFEEFEGRKEEDAGLNA